MDLGREVCNLWFIARAFSWDRRKAARYIPVSRVMLQSLIEPSRRILDDCPPNPSTWSANNGQHERHYGNFSANMAS